MICCASGSRRGEAQPGSEPALLAALLSALTPSGRGHQGRMAPVGERSVRHHAEIDVGGAEVCQAMANPFACSVLIAPAPHSRTEQADPGTPPCHPSKRTRSLDTTPATSLTSCLQRRQRGSRRLSALLAAATGALAIAGQQGDPAAMRLAPVGTPDSTLTIGAVITLTGNASVIGQDQRLGLELARDHFQGNVQDKGPALELTIQDGGSDEGTATNAFRSLIGANVVALTCPFVARVAPPCSMPKTTPTRPRSRRSFSSP